jgi:hypothetical protein
VKKEETQKENGEWLQIGRQKMKVPKARVSGTLSFVLGQRLTLKETKRRVY